MALLDQFLANQATLSSTETTDQNRDIALEKFNEKKNLRSVGIGALEALAFKDEESQNQFLGNRIKEIQARGGDATDSLEALDMPFAQRQDVLKGAVDIAQRAGALEGAGSSAFGVRAQKILADGTTIQSMSDGTTRVISKAGQVLEGEAAAAAIAAANEEAIRIAGGTAGAKTGSSELEKRESELTKEMTTNLQKSPVAIRRLGRILDVFNAADTGTPEAFKSALGKIFPGATSSELEDAMSASGDFILNNLSKLKGAISEKELAFIQGMSPNVRNSPEGNRLIIQRLIQEEKDKLELAQRMKEHKQGGERLEDFDVAGFIARKEAERDENFSVQNLEDALGLLDPAATGGLSPEDEAELAELEALEAKGEL